MNWEKLKNLLGNKTLCILGFGREGKATLDFLLQHFSGDIVVADMNPETKNYLSSYHSSHLLIQTGEHYLDEVNHCDLIIKTPGIPRSELRGKIDLRKITSQADLFLSIFSSQVTGVTGTKGKSTTSSLIHHIFSSAGKHSVLLGNIGTPAMSLFDKIRPETSVVFELSSHQLEDVGHSPHISLLLNIFEEHLDHYSSFEEYRQAKYNITRYQKSDDVLIYHSDNSHLQNSVINIKSKAILMPYSMEYKQGMGAWWEKDIICIIDGNETRRIVPEGPLMLRGEHNRSNILAACTACLLNKIPEKIIGHALPLFEPLPHRLEYVGHIDGKHFYNDSIATIPEATIAAIHTLGKVDTLIVGGYNRGINYEHLIEFLAESEVFHLMLIGEVGKIIEEGLRSTRFNGEIRFYNDFEQLVEDAILITPEGGTCLLSPAAASYDRFINFEERGNLFKNIVLSYSRGMK
ncbi:MAG: UDP-N-acetylmuramoyl-L-alanine--D-glutamate ligase [Bacteroidota bacterium]|nr:UDP-N-acetylmuramoyl-L-alanine--D-glutamate ligase [Bacteroidota bacterium]